MLILKAQILQLCLDREKSQAMGQWRIEVKRLARDLELLCRKHRTQRSHIVQTVGDLDQDNPDIITHRQQQLAEILRLGRGLATKNTTGDLRQSIDNLGDLVAKHITDILYRIFRILDDIMKQGGTDRSGAQSHLTANNPSHGDRMHNIRFARTPLYASVRLVREVKSLSDALDLAPVIRLKVILQQLIEAILNHLLLGRQIGRGSNRRSRICCVLCIAHGLSLLLFFKQYEHKYMGNNREYYRIRTRFLHKK